jgi:hypothetical protein
MHVPGVRFADRPWGPEEGSHMKIRLPMSIGHANSRTGDPGCPDLLLVSRSARERVRGHLERSGRALAATLLCLMVLGVRGAAAVTTLVVDDDGMASVTDCNALTPAFMTITAAEAVAMPGDTIKVCPGLYAEQVQITVNNLTLKGAQFGVDARTRPFVPDPTTQSIIDHPCGPVQIFADNVAINGFTVQGSTLSDPCFISGIWMNPGSHGPDQGGAQILNNIVQSNVSGIELDSTCAANPTLVQFNLIQNNSNPGPGAGNGIQTNFGLCNGTIDRNKFSGHINSSVLVFGPPVTAVASNIAVTNNELVGGTPEAISFLGVSTSTISGNVSIGSTNAFGTIDLFGGNSGVMITSNTLFNGNRAIVVDNPFSSFGIPPNSAIEAHSNCIDGNTIAGMQVDSGGHLGRLNAENNWWGSANGPTSPNNPGGTGDAVIDPDGVVDFIPFLKSCPSGAAAPSMVTGGGQVNVNMTGGRGSFGFSAKLDTQSGHLDYMNHVTRAHLNCKVTSLIFLTATHARLSGGCTSNSAAMSFTADVEDNAKQGKNADKFKITYGANIDEGGPGPIVSGNIEIK